MPSGLKSAVGWVTARQLPEGMASRNVATVVQDGAVAADEICVGDLQAACTELGIS